MKRILSLFLVLLMCLSLAPMVALADAEEIEAAPAEAVEESEAEPAPAPEPEPEPEPDPEPAPIEESVAEPVEVPAAELEAAPAAAQPAAAVEAVSDTAEPQANDVVYSITYYRNDGYDSSFLRRNHTPGDTVYLNEVSLSRDPTIPTDGSQATRYILSGWNTAKDGTGTSYSLTDTLVMPEESISLYAMWDTAEQYYWALTVEGHGTVTYQPLVVSPSSDAWLTAGEGDVVKLYVSSQRKVRVGTIHGFTPTPEEGYIFDGWYLYSVDDGEKLNVTKLTSNDLKDLVLGSSIWDAGRNKIVARFIENDGTYASVKFQREEDGTVTYYQQMLKIGSDMPTVEDPTWKNHYFLGWDAEVPATVPDTDVTFTAQWLEGPTNANTAEELYTIRCTTGDDHPDEAQGMYWGVSNDDIAYDEARGVYTCTVTLDTIGTYLGVGPGSYAVISGQEHFTVDSKPVISLVWNGTQWVADGEQIVEVYHETGDEEIPTSVLAAMDPIICVTETGNASNYKKLRLIDGTYDIEYLTTTGSTRTARVTVTDFDAYARQLGANYAPDWDNNLHDQDYYVFYLTRTLKTESTANGSTYLAWSSWGYDKLSTEFQSVGGVLNNEFTYGKELLVKLPTCTLTFVDEMEVLPTQTFEVAVGSAYPEYDWTDEAVDADIAAAIENGEPIWIDEYEAWYVFAGWDGYPLALFGKTPTVSGDETFTALWEPVEVYTVAFTDGRDGEVFKPVEYVIKAEDGQFPWADSMDDLSVFELGLFPDLYEMQLEDGSIFLGWDPDLYDYAAENQTVTEDVTFEAMWAKPVTVIYRDGADGEVFEEYVADTFFPGYMDFPAFWMDDSDTPVREGYAFVDWVSAEDEEASYTFIDEDTGYTVNAYQDGDYTEFVILLDAQWEPDFAVTAQVASLLLDGTIGVNFKVLLPDEVLASETAQAVFIYKNNEYPVSIADMKPDSQGRYVFTYRVPAKEFANPIYLQFKDGDTIIPIVYPSGDPVADYRLMMSGQLYSEKLAATGNKAVPLVNSLRNYCAAAYIGLNDSTDEQPTFTDDFDVSGVTADTLEPFKSTSSGSVTGLNLASQSLTLETTTEINLKFALSGDHTIDEYTFTLDGKTVTPAEIDGRWVVIIPDIAAKHLDTRHTLTVTNESETLTVTCTALSYGYSVLANNLLTEAMRTTIRAMYLYNCEANDYFGG